MKRILCFVFSVLMLLSVFAVFVSAEDAAAVPSVMKELAQLQIDGKPFSELMDAKFPANASDKNLYIITAVEKAFTDASSVAGFEMYFYIYNPSCMEIKEDIRNSVQIGIDENCQYMNYYGAKVYSVSEDKRFLKIGLVNNNLYSSYYGLCMRQSDTNRRVYNVVQLRLRTANGLESFTTKRVFFFEGFSFDNTLKSYWKDMDVLEVELHATNWISPNAGLKVDGETEASVYDHYEIHSVYFRVPKEYWDTYEFLYSIRATYDRVHLTPIIVTHQNDADFSDDEGQATKNAIIAGTSLSGSPNLEVYDLGWTEGTGVFDHRHVYSDSEAVHNRADETSSVIGALPGQATHHDALAYYFATLKSDFEYTDGASLQKAAISSAQLKAYFDERYNNPNYSNTLLYSEYISKQNLDLEGTQFYADGIYAMKDYQEILSTKSLWEQWWTRVITEKDSSLFDRFADQAEHISVVKNPSAYVTISTDKANEVSNALFIHEADLSGFSEVCRQAAAEGDYVVLLRLGFNDYYCAPVQDNYEAALGFGTGPYVAVAVDKWVYRNVSVAELIFSKNGELHSVPVSSNVIDNYGHSDVSGDPMINGPADIVDEIGDRARDSFGDFWEGVKEFLFWIGVALAVFVGLLILLRVLRKKEKKETVTINLVDPDAGGGKKPKRRKREK